jgi:hypothetical protein
MAKQVPRKQALLVGVSDYQGTRYDLPGINQDIKKMSKLFKAWGFDIKILQGKDSLNLAHYLHAYANGKNKLVEGDIFAFYFSGHGSYVADQYPRDETDHRDETLVLSNGYTNIHFLDDQLNYYLSRIKARKIELFDSCHSGTVNKGGASDKGVQKTMPPNKANIVHNQMLRRIKKAAYKDKACHIVGYCKHSNENNDDSRLAATNTAFRKIPTPHVMDNQWDDYFNRTKTKKRNLFDFCYCETARKKELHDKIMPSSVASISYKLAPHLLKSPAKSGDVIVFSASQDTEKSLGKDTGSLFTNEFYIQFSSRFNQQRRSLKLVHDHILYNIVLYCKHHGENQFHPQLSVSHPALKGMTMAEYLRIEQ